MRVWTALTLVLLTVACGGDDGTGLDPSAEVGSLSDGDLRVLCKHFASEVCMAFAGEPYCDGTCCEKPDIPAQMRTECIAGITVDDVNDCSGAVASEDANAFTICTQQMGGCVFDVFDEQCP